MASSSHDYDDGGSDDASVQLNPRQEVKRFIRNIKTPGTFAFGSSLLAPSPKLTVQGLGSISLPLSNEDVGALRGAAERAPFGHGAETKVDESVRRAWQIDGSLLGLSNEFAQAVGKKYALHAAGQLGLRAKALGVEARLYKLVMYENGGHFRPHKDTEKEAGMFGTLVVQLPTAAGHKGGSLIVRHRRKQHIFAWEDPDGSYAQRLGGGAAAAVAGTAAGPAAAADGVDGGMASTPPSSLPVRCAAFYGDCEHELQTVTSGVRLCLLYNLVRTTPGPQPVGAVGQSGSAAQLRLSDAVAAWGRPGSSCAAAKFIVPLEHEYTRVNMLFGGLKGRDRAMADSLRTCRDLDLYLAHVVKHESGTAAPQHPQYGYRGRGSSPGYGCGPRKRRKKCPYDSDYTSADVDSDDGDMFSPDYDDDDYESDAEDQEMDYENDVETDVAAKNWVACNDERMYLDLGIDIESELLGCDDDDDAEYDEEEAMELLFPGNEPDKREYEGYTGNYSPSLEFWYHRAVLVLWPAPATMRTALRCGTHAALSAARQRSTRYGATDTLPLADLATIVSLAEKKPEEYEFAKEDRYAVAVLDLCAGAGAAALDSSRRFLQLLGGGTPGAVEIPGFRGDRLSQGVAALVRAVGWQAVGGDVLQMVKASALGQARYIAGLAWKLSTVPQQQQQQQQHAAGGGDSNDTSAGALVASTYAGGIASDPPALKRVTAYGAAGIVRLFLLRLPCCNGTCYGTDPQLLSFARVGSVHLQTTALVAAVHELLMGLPTILKNSTAAAGVHSSAVVTLATKLCSRGFQRLGETEVKTFAEDVLWLAAHVDGAGGLEQGFAGAVLTSLRSGDSSQVRKGHGKLKAVLESETVQAAVRYGGGSGAVFWRTLVSERLKKLATIAPPVMTWRQPNAIFHEHPQVQQFLRGPEPKMTYTRSGTFSNKQHARNFARKYFSSSFSEPRHFSARCYEQGRGRGAYVSITKTTEFYDEDVRVYKEDTAEAAVLRGLLGNNKGSGRGRSGGGTAGGENGAGGGGGGGSTSAPPPSFVRGNASNSVGTAAAGTTTARKESRINGSVGEGRHEKVEVIDLCSD